MKTRFTHHCKWYRILTALALVLALLPFSCFGEAAVQEATSEQIYTENSWAFDFDEDFQFTETEMALLKVLYLWEYNEKIADWCREEAAKCAEGSKTREQYENYEKILRGAQPGLPTEEESKQNSEKALSNISTQLKEEAVDYYKRCVEAEPKITADLFEIAGHIGTEMFGIKYRLKSAGDNAEGVCRFADKIDEKLKAAEKAGKPISYKEAAEDVHDLVRYTMAATPETLVEDFLRVKELLEAKGYSFLKIKNTWETYTMNAPYRGLNTQIMSPYGIVFELQFHTAESLVTKSVTHSLYETARDPRIDVVQKASLLNQMYDLFARMTAPDGISKIESVK